MNMIVKEVEMHKTSQMKLIVKEVEILTWQEFAALRDQLTPEGQRDLRNAFGSAKFDFVNNYVTRKCDEKRRREIETLTSQIFDVDDVEMGPERKRREMTSRICDMESGPESVVLGGSATTINKATINKESQPSEIKSSESETVECVVCMDRPKTHALNPCGHLCVCQLCVSS